MKPFKKLFGNRVYLEIPKVPESSVILSEEAQKNWIEQQKLALNRFKVYAVGDGVTTIKEGDEVAVDMLSLQRNAPLRLNKELEVLQVSVFDIAHLWNDL